jgi:agmatine deiminase
MITSRREVLILLSTFAFPSIPLSASAQEKRKLFMPHEANPHEQSFMTLSNAPFLYGKSWNHDIQKEQALIANTLVDFEPVTVIVDRKQEKIARKIFRPEINFMFLPHFDIWARDTLPIFVLENKNILQAVVGNFNVWGNKFTGYKEYDLDKKLAPLVADTLNIPTIFAPFVFEGGAIDVDGDGSLLTTRSCLLNPNRNPDMSEKEVSQHLSSITGAEKIIWLHGSQSDKITDGHIDGIARFIEPGLVVAEYTENKSDLEYSDLKKNIKQLEKARDAKGRLLEVITLARPDPLKTRTSSADFSASYINNYVANGVLLLPEFGDDKHDQDAYDLFSRFHPSRKTISLNVDNICKGGGGIHCTLQTLPKAL